MAEADRSILVSLASYIGDHYASHFAELFRKAKGTLPLEYRKKMLERMDSCPTLPPKSHR